MAQVIEPYGFDGDFEKVVLWYMASNGPFWGLVGHSMEADAFEHPLGKLIADTCRRLGREMGRGPGSTLIVIQRLKRKVHEGKVTQAQVTAAFDLFEDVEDAGVPELELVINELLPLLKRRLHSKAILAAHDEYARRGDFTAVQDIIDQASRLGVVEKVASTRVGTAGFDRIEQSQIGDRLPTGVLELDLMLKGGWPRKSLMMWLADTGGGKSMALVNQSGVAMRQQMFSGFITLELPEHVQLARLYANLTGVPVDDILDIKRWRDEAKRRVHMIEDQLGACELAEFSPHATTVQDVVEWIEQQEQNYGAKMQLLVVDYADKMTATGCREDNQYLMMRLVYEALRRDIANARDMWVVTGSQSTGRDKKRGILDTRHGADSMHKVRISDIVASLNPDEDPESDQFEIFMAKNRLGKKNYLVGPLIHDFERARLVPVTQELGKW